MAHLPSPGLPAIKSVDSGRISGSGFPRHPDRMVAHAQVTGQNCQRLILDSAQATVHCEFMQHSNFIGRIFTEQVDAGQAEVDIEFTRTGISAMTAKGQFFEIAFSECELRVGGVKRRLLFCHNCKRSLTICCADRAFPRALCQASLGLLDVQLERQFRKWRREPQETSLLALNIITGIALLVVGAYLAGQF